MEACHAVVNGNAVDDGLPRKLRYSPQRAYGVGFDSPEGRRRPAAGLKADRREIETIVTRARDTNYGFRSLLHEVVQSALFQNK